MQHASSAVAESAAADRPGWPPASRLAAEAPDLSTEWLSGVASRRRLLEYLDDLLTARQADKPGLVLVDIDPQHLLGEQVPLLLHDRLLCRAAQRLRVAVPQALLLARVESETFALVLPRAEEMASAGASLAQLLGRSYAVSGTVLHLGVCHAGLAAAGDAPGDIAGESGVAWLQRAAQALLAVQRQHPAEIHPFAPSPYERARIRQAMESDLHVAMLQQQMALRRAVVAQQFELHYQPQISLACSRLTGFEALLRWRHPQRGLVGPAEFLPLAEEIGLVEPLGEWVLRTACRDAMAWPVPPGGAPLRVSVNLSAAQLRAGAALTGTVERALQESGLDPGRLELEMTEQALADGVGDTLITIHRLGVALALDNFGTGQAALGLLRAHPFSRFKIDRCFVADLGRDDDGGCRRAGAWMIRGFAALGVGLGLETVVEGIETPAQRDIAARAGCGFMQGFLVSRPLPGTAVAALIERLGARHSEENHHG
jgi:predicted signal transduction protein with EAL and GGDEF domain